MDRKPRYVVEKPGAHGVLHYYWQPHPRLFALGFRPERIPLDPDAHRDGAALRVAAYARALELNAAADAAREHTALTAARPTPVPHTLGALSTHYRRSEAWRGLAPATRRGYGQCLAKLEAWGGDESLRAIDEAAVQDLKDAFRRTPAYANAIVRVLRLLLEHGRRNSFLHANVAMRPGLHLSEPSGLIWPREAVRAFAAAADAMGRPSVGTAVVLNEWLGQREGDVLRLPRHAWRAGSLIVRQSKTGARVSLPVSLVPHLAERLEAELARTRSTPATAIILSEETRRPYTADNFRHVFSAVRARAAKTSPHFDIDYLLPGRDAQEAHAFRVRMRELTFMHLRHTAVTRLAEAGCDTPLIASVTGHSQETVAAIMNRYMVRTAELARVAFQRRLDAEQLVLPSHRKETG